MSIPKTETRLRMLLHEAGLITTDLTVSPESLPTSTPWYIALLQGFSGWLASIFILFMFGMMFAHLFDQPVVLLVIGSILIAIARSVLHNADTTLFFEQAAFALSLAGQAMMAFAFFHWFHEDGFSHPSSLVWFFLAGVELILIVSVSHYFHRLVSAFIFVLSLIGGGIVSGMGFLMVPVILGATAYSWQSEYQNPKIFFFKQAIGNGMTLGLFWLVVSGFSPASFWLPFSGETIGWLTNPWVTSGLNGVVLISTVYALSRQPKYQIHLTPSGIAFLLVIALLASQMHGLAIAVTLLILGFARGHLRLQQISSAMLLWSVGYFYYTLHITLLLKSAMLSGGGVLMLTIYALIRRTKHHDLDNRGSHDAH